jgi:phosphodiesterase/alkaline phosphatase D-like protein
MSSVGRRVLGILLCLVALAVRASDGRAAPPGPLLVAVGDVGPRSALLWLRVPGPVPTRLEVGAAGDPSVRRLEVAPAPEADFTAKVRIDGLDPGTRYAYRVRWQAETVGAEFVTAPEAGVAAPVTLLWSGDLGGGGRCRVPGDGYPIFSVMAPEERRGRPASTAKSRRGFPLGAEVEEMLGPQRVHEPCDRPVPSRLPWALSS